MTDITPQVGLSGTFDARRITIYEGSESWSALYLDGNLVSHGDHHNVIEKLVELIGVEWRQDDAFLAGDGRTVLQTVQQVETRVANREADLKQADEYEGHAKSLQEKAARLRRAWQR